MNTSPIPKTGNRNPVKVTVTRLQRARAALAKAGCALRHLGYEGHANEVIGAVRLLSGWIDGVLDDARAQPTDMTCPVCQKPIKGTDKMESTGYINYHAKCCAALPANPSDQRAGGSKP